MILPGIEDPRNCLDPQHHGLSNWDQKLRMIACVFSLYDKMRWKWDDTYPLWGRPIIYSLSLYTSPLPLYFHMPGMACARCTWRLWASDLGDVLGRCDRARFKTHLEAMIERVWRCTWRPPLCKIGGRIDARLEIYVEAVIERVWRCTWKPEWSKIGDALGGCNRAGLEMHFETMIVQTWRPWSYELRDALGGCDRASLKMLLEEVMVRTWRPHSCEFWDTHGHRDRARMKEN